MKNNARSPLIPASLFKKNIISFLFLLLFCVLLTYSVSSIVYFTSLVIATGGSNKYEVGVIIQNVIYSGVAAVVLLIFLRFIDNRIRTVWIKYVLLFLLIEIASFFASYYIYINIWRDLQDYSRNGAPTVNLGLVSTIIPGIVGVIYYYFWKASQQVNKKMDEQEVRLLQLQQNKTRAELAALEARINPHFLYNALNSIASLVHESPDTAEEMTMNLSKLFRKTTGKNSETFCTLEEEIELVKTYLKIEQVRFGNRLQFEANIPEKCKSHALPTFIIQPLVENAIKHGISGLTGQGIIGINARCEDNLLTISVADNGPDFELGENSGYGLTSIQEKLRLLYQDKGTISVHNSPQKEVVITLPIEN